MPTNVETSQVSVRDAQLDDAAAVNTLLLTRLYDSLPGCGAYVDSEAAYFRKRGLQDFETQIGLALRDHDTNYFSVAENASKLVGFAAAFAIDGEDFTRCAGIYAIRDGLGIGSLLERHRNLWLRRVGRPALARVVCSNLQSSGFLIKNGYKFDGYAIVPGCPRPIVKLRLDFVNCV